MPRIIFCDSNLNSLPLDMNVRRGVYGLYLAMDVIYIPVPAKENLHGKTGDYYVTRADNRRILGRLMRKRDLLGRPVGTRWEVRAVADAFRGDHFDDTGDILDEVPNDLSRLGSDWHALDIATDRDEGATYLLEYLYRNQAPAMGFGRHRDVSRHESPLRSGKSVTRRTMAAGPFPTVESRDELNLSVYTVPADAKPLRFDTPSTVPPKLTKTQAQILKQALIDNDRVWGDLAQRNLISLRKLHEYGYIYEPESGTRLTDTGRQVALRVLLSREV